MLFSTVKRISPWMSGTENEPSQSAAARDGCRITALSAFTSRTSRPVSVRIRRARRSSQAPALVSRAHRSAIRAATTSTAIPAAEPSQTVSGTDCTAPTQFVQSNCCRTLPSIAGLIAIAPTSSETWHTRPASELSPTEPTAAPRPSPSRCRKRTFTAIWPVPAGSRWLTKEAATWTAKTLLTGGVAGIEPNWVTVPTTNSIKDRTVARLSQSALAAASALMPFITSFRLSTPMMTTATATTMASRIWGSEESASALRSSEADPRVPCLRPSRLASSESVPRSFN